MKVGFQLTRDDEGWPPADWEHLWAIPRGTDQYELDNIPFFATGVACGDIVEAKRDDDELLFECVLTGGGHSTIRVIMYESDRKEEIRKLLADLGCETEASHLPSLFAVDIPPSADYQRIVEFLDLKNAEEILEYEEAQISPEHQ